MATLNLNRPKLRSYIYIVAMEDAIQVRDKDKIYKFSGKSAFDIVPQLIRLFDGTRTIGEIVSSITGYSHETVMSIIDLFYKKRLLEEGSILSPFSEKENEFFSDQIAFFSHFADNKYMFQKQLQDARVTIIGLDSTGSYLAQLLARSGVGTIVLLDNEIVKSEDVGIVFSDSDKNKMRCDVTKAKCEAINSNVNILCHTQPLKSEKDVLPFINDCNLAVLIADSFCSSTYTLLNTVCLTKNVTWTSCFVDSAKGIIGPTIIPRQTPCYTCYDLRAKSNIINYEEYLAFEQHVRSHPNELRGSGKLYSFSSIIAGFVTLEAVKILTNIAPAATFGNILVLDFLTMKMQKHPILKIPRCPDCGLPAKQKRTLKVWMG